MDSSSKYNGNDNTDTNNRRYRYRAFDLYMPSQLTGSIAAGESEIFTVKFPDEPNVRAIDIDSQYWANYVDGAISYLKRPTTYSVTVPAGTAANTTYLVADGKIIKNWDQSGFTDVTGNVQVPNLLSVENAYVLLGNLDIAGATAGVTANIRILPPLTRNSQLPGSPTDLNSIVQLWSQSSLTLLANDATAASTIPVTDFDLTGLKCRDIALVVKVVTAPAADTAVSLSFTGKVVAHKWG
ncbi:MAG: hypothetical protein QXF17_04315 [Ignisphaera sp.]